MESSAVEFMKEQRIYYLPMEEHYTLGEELFAIYEEDKPIINKENLNYYLNKFCLTIYYCDDRHSIIRVIYKKDRKKYDDKKHYSIVNLQV